MFCAPRRMFVFRAALDTSLSAVKGGQMTMSTSLMFANSRLSPFTKSSASATVLFIFQLPAMISLRALSTVLSFRFAVQSWLAGRLLSLHVTIDSTVRRLLVAERRHAGQHFALQKLQTRAAAGADECHLATQPGQVQRLHAVAAADDAL